MNNPTSLQFGPDGRLYVAPDGRDDQGVHGRAAGPEQRTPSRPTETITLDSVDPEPRRQRHAQPVGHRQAGHRHPGGRHGGEPADLRRVVGSAHRRRAASAATWTSTRTPASSRGSPRWAARGRRSDLVRGLPRSEENHSGNGMALDPATNKLLIAYGGNTNKGAPSNNFAMLPEYALSARSCRSTSTRSATRPTTCRRSTTRTGRAPRRERPLRRQRREEPGALVPGGPVQVYAPGFRNPYDLVVTPGGPDVHDRQRRQRRVGGRAGGRGRRPGPAPTSRSTNSDTDQDALIRITGPGFYGGHPNPTRANRPTRSTPPTRSRRCRPAIRWSATTATEAERGR